MLDILWNACDGRESGIPRVGILPEGFDGGSTLTSPGMHDGQELIVGIGSQMFPTCAWCNIDSPGPRGGNILFDA